MTLHDLWAVSPRSFIFIRNKDESVTQYDGGDKNRDAVILDVMATEYPMYKNVLEVKIKEG